MSQAIPVSDSEFKDKVLDSQGVCVIDFWAEWCGPCKALSPIVDELAKDYSGKVSIFKMNIDHNPSTPQQFQIRGIPTLLIFKDGKVVDRIVGAQPKVNIAKTLDSHLV